MLLSLLNSHSTCTSAHSGTCMNERAHTLKASILRPTGGFESCVCATRSGLEAVADEVGLIESSLGLCGESGLPGELVEGVSVFP